MSSDNRTQANAANTVTNWSGQGKEATNTTVGQRYEGSGAIEDQHSNSDEDTYTTSISGSPVNMSDMTVYGLIKDNLVDTYANGGIQFLIGDGTDRIGYDVAGNDAAGLALSPFYNAIKLDVSALPASFTTYAGSEGNLTVTAITAMGYGTLHLAKAVGSIANCYFDSLWYIANDSYALTINGGTVGTPETMADVQGDDVTNGWGLVANPLGDQFQFFGPTEWGEDAANADHYFEATNEQWFWIGDNAGGHAVAATHFPFRVIGNATDTGSFVISNVSIVNTGTPAEFDCSSANVDTLEIDGCTMVGLASFEAPSSGGTSRFCTNTIFVTCGQVTHNGASVNGSAFIESAAAANGAALYYDETSDPDGEMDDLTFSQGTAAHHAITFGANIPSSVTITGADFSGFSSSDDNNGSVFRFEDTSGNITLNLSGCTHDGSGFTVDDRAGCTVTVVIDPVTTLVNVKDNTGVNLQDARVYLKAADGTGPMPYQDSVTITRATTTATVTHTAHGMETGDKVVIKGITDKTEDNAGVKTITVLTANTYTYVTDNSGSTNYTGTIVATWVALEGLTDVSGNISRVKSYAAAQPVSGRVRKSTTSPRFKNFDIAGTIDTSTGLTINVRMILDE